jgi:PPK2 family polyphosphate:nucleotide phosphotransferase
MPHQPVVIRGEIRLKDFDPSFHGDRQKQETKKRTKTCARRIGELQDLLFANSRESVLLIFQGLDASGKDGAIRHVLQAVNPAGVRTTNFKVPSADEAAHDYLWRVHRAVPPRGYLGVFNRSHYESVLAERVLFDLPAKEVRARCRQIVDFERMLVENGVVILKFFLHLSRAEQRERFEARLTVPRKKWKFSAGDLVVRKRWDDYMRAYEEMLSATSHPEARWHVVPADRKWYRNHVVATTTVQAMEALKLKWPKPKEDLSRIHIK